MASFQFWSAGQRPSLGAHEGMVWALTKLIVNYRRKLRKLTNRGDLTNRGRKSSPTEAEL
jgi:hypothetical protein